MEFNDLIGVPFVDGGRSPDTGLDCWGLALEIYRRAGVALPDFKISAMDAATINAELSANEGKWKKLPRNLRQTIRWLIHINTKLLKFLNI